MKRLENVQKVCVISANFFNVTYAVLLLRVHKCQLPRGVQNMDIFQDMEGLV